VLSRIPLNFPLLVVVLSWGFNFVSLKVLYHDMSAPAVMFNRTIVMAVVLAGVVKARGLSLRYRKGDAWRLLLAGLVSMGIYMAVFLEGLQRTTPAEAAIMLATAPVFTFFLASAVKQETFTWSALMGSLIGFAGVATVILGGGAGAEHGSLLGNLMTLASAFLWSIGVVIMRPMLHRYDPTQAFTLSIPGCIPVMLLYGLSPALHTNYAAISPLGWGMFAQVTLLSGVIAFVCFYIGIHQIGPSRATMYQFFIPPMAAIFQWLIYGRALAPLQWLGLAVLMSGVIYTSQARARAARQATA
jgi:drug/metabolite transporter (DMT)-like permease